MNARGMSLVELLVVIAVLALCLSLALAFARPSHALRAAEASRAAILWARANALWRGEAVSVTELPGGAGLVVRLEAGLPRGIVWLPSGSGRTCDGGGVVSATLRLADARRRVAVVVSSLGRVRLEVGP